MKFRIATFLPVALFAVMGVVLAFGLTNDPRLLPSVLQDKQLPEFDLAPLEEGRPRLKSVDLTGQGVTLINVFGSWCVSCRYEHPLLMRISTDKRFRLVGIDWKDAPDDAKKYLAAYGNPFALIGTDQSGRTAIDLGVTGAPETFVVDTKGRVLLCVPGPLTPEIWEQQIEPLLNPTEKAS